MQNHAKPLGITLIALWSVLNGLIFIPVGLIFELAGSIHNNESFSLLLGYGSTILGVFLLAGVYGLWSLQNWGRDLIYWIYLAMIPISLIQVITPSLTTTYYFRSLIITLAEIGINIKIMAYLSQPTIRLLFLANTNEIDTF